MRPLIADESISSGLGNIILLLCRGSNSKSLDFPGGLLNFGDFQKTADSPDSLK